MKKYVNLKPDKNKNKINLNKCIMPIVTVSIVFTGFKVVSTKVSAYREEQIKKIELEKEQIRKEEEAKRKVIGVKNEYKKYSYDAMKVAEKLKKYDYSNNGEKVVFLTFDDGASTTNTSKILDILEREGVRATFFVTGDTIENGGEKSRELIKREFENGNAIANHSYSHNYKTLYPNRTLNLDNFLEDFKKTDDILKSILGDNFSTRVIRCPGGHMSWKGMEPLDDYLKENNMASIDWNALNGDAEGKKKNADELVQYAENTAKGKEMVVLLMHDTYGKEETVKALPRIINYFKTNGYEFKTLA